MYEDNLEYAARRLNDTVVRDKRGALIHIKETHFGGKGLMHTAMFLDKGNMAEVDHKDVDLEPIPLGFVNATNDMTFVCRKPMRRDWHQGLSRTSIQTYGPINAAQLPIKLLVQPVQNQYPSYQVALKLLDKKNSVAFSRDFGLKKEGETVQIIFRQYVVGEVVGAVPRLLPKKFFLEQHLAEAIG